ncbi:MAG: PoNe immunity protein domain-containing protein [Pseudomonas mandelii]
MTIRQKYFSEKRYNNFLREHDELIEFFLINKFRSDSDLEETSQRARYFQTLALDRILVTYTAGENIESLIPLLKDLIGKYEIRQKALADYQDAPNISPLAIDDWLNQYEEAVQVISLCILLHRTDLLSRFVKFIDDAGYAGEDTLYEALLNKVMPNRHDVDEWYHDVYTPLIQAIYTDSEDEPPKLLKKYCEHWYPAFKQSPWHDSHLHGDEGSYVGYWAFEAGAIAFLYGIDDSKIDHMVYPRDLVDYARCHSASNASVPEI